MPIFLRSGDTDRLETADHCVKVKTSFSGHKTPQGCKIITVVMRNYCTCITTEFSNTSVYVSNSRLFFCFSADVPKGSVSKRDTFD